MYNTEWKVETKKHNMVGKICIAYCYSTDISLKIDLKFTLQNCTFFSFIKFVTASSSTTLTMIVYTFIHLHYTCNYLKLNTAIFVAGRLNHSFVYTVALLSLAFSFIAHVNMKR